MLKRPTFRDLRDETIWLAGLFDGEGCVYMGVSTRKHTKERIDCWLMIGMTHQPTIELAAEILGKISGDPGRVKFRPPSPDARYPATKRKDKWVTATSSKRGTLRALNAMLPFLCTKQIEARLMIQFLERATMTKKYMATKVDLFVADVVRRLKHGDGEAPADAAQLLRGEVIPNQAISGLDGASSEVEGLQTTRVMPKDPSHECPTTLEKDNESVH